MNMQYRWVSHFLHAGSRKPQETQNNGQALTEYALLLGFVALVLLAVLSTYTDELVRAFERISFTNNGSGMTRSIVVKVVDYYDALVSDVQVFAYTDQGEYVGLSDDTNSEGIALFQPEDGNYQFLIYYQGQWIWSDIVSWPQQDYTEIKIKRAIFQVRVVDVDGNLAYDIPVYAFTETGEYMGLYESTRRNGMAAFYLIVGNVQFRADANGSEHWSPVVHTDQGEVTITLNTCAPGTFMAEYFDNRNLAGNPVFAQCEETINYDWGNNGPGNGIGKNNFSVRWTGSIPFTEGRYRVTTTVEEGVRLWVDNSLLVDAWQNGSETTYHSLIDLTAGIHEFKMEYFKGGGKAVAKLSWNEVVTSCPDGEYLAEYYNNRNLSGDPTLAQCESSINYDWGTGSPAEGIDNNDFSVRWTGKMAFNDATYGFTATANDGVRVWLDNQLFFDEWRNQNSATTYLARTNMTAGLHTIKMEYYENNGDTAAQLSWEEVVTSCKKGEFLAEYFNNRTMSGTPIFSRCETKINNDWGPGGPGNGVDTNNFSIKWQGTFDLTDFEYTFTATGDDGIQVFVDNSLVINAWQDHGATDYLTKYSTTAGEHVITMYYYERFGNAVAKLDWYNEVTDEVP